MKADSFWPWALGRKRLRIHPLFLRIEVKAFKITVIKDDVNTECEDPAGSQMGKQTDVTPFLCDPEKVQFRQGILAIQMQNHCQVFLDKIDTYPWKTAKLLTAGNKKGGDFWRQNYIVF